VNVSRSTSTRRLLAAGVTALAAAAATLAPSATAAPPKPAPIAKSLLTPLSVAVADDGAVYYSENFAGKLWVKRPGKKAKALYTDAKHREVGAISAGGDTVYFVRGAALLKRNAKGKIRVVAALGAHEKNRNPDRHVTYGAPGLSPECVEQWPSEGAPPPVYTGIVESHPYATAVDGRVVYVADAAGNSILKVRPDGTVRTVAVLPPVKVTISEQMAEAGGLPECAVGESYAFEPVPTDVEVGPRGKLYVSSLPGGPEDGSVPGGVFTVNPKSGAVRRIASGLVSATGLDVSANGTVFVSELFAGKITRIPAGGSPRTYTEVPLPAAVELARGGLYATIGVLPGENEPPAGMVVRFRR
jgi:streptogramin lyase